MERVEKFRKFWGNPSKKYENLETHVFGTYASVVQDFYKITINVNFIQFTIQILKLKCK